MNDEYGDLGEWIPDEPVWDEFEWERFLQEQDRRAERYLELMDRYQDDPDRDNIVAREMGWEHLVKECNAEDPDCSTCDKRWRCSYFQYFHAGEDDADLPSPTDLPSADPSELPIEIPVDDMAGEPGGEPGGDPGDAPVGDPVGDPVTELINGLVDGPLGIEFETDDEEGEEYDPEAFQNDPLYQEAFSLGAWLYHFFDSVPGSRTHEPVVRLLSHANIIAAKIAAGIGDGEFDEIGMTIAYLKRALRACNVALDAVRAISDTDRIPAYEVEKIRRKIFSVRDGIVTLVGECRQEWQRRYGQR